MRPLCHSSCPRGSGAVTGKRAETAEKTEVREDQSTAKSLGMAGRLHSLNQVAMAVCTTPVQDEVSQQPSTRRGKRLSPTPKRRIFGQMEWRTWKRDPEGVGKGVPGEDDQNILCPYMKFSKNKLKSEK